MGLDQLIERWIGHGPIIEIGAERQQNDDRPLRLRQSRDEQIDEALTFPF